MLVKLLTGVFDPPPEGLAIPVAYLGGVGMIVAGIVWLAIRIAQRRLDGSSAELLRES